MNLKVKDLVLLILIMQGHLYAQNQPNAGGKLEEAVITIYPVSYSVRDINPEFATADKIKQVGTILESQGPTTSQIPFYYSLTWRLETFSAIQKLKGVTPRDYAWQTEVYFWSRLKTDVSLNERAVYKAWQTKPVGWNNMLNVSF